jgi:hypothetical protein
VGTTQSLVKQLTQYGVKGLAVPTDKQIFDFVDPSLNHSSPRDQAFDLMTENQRKLYAALQDQSALSWNEQAIPQISSYTKKILQQEQLLNTNP